MPSWIMDRSKEPSTWAAAGGVIVGIGFLVGQPVIIIVGIVVGALGFVLKEKGVL